MNTLVVLVAVIAVASAATPAPKEAAKAFPFSSEFLPSNQAYYPGYQGFYPGYQGYQGYQGYNAGFRGSYYPGYQAGYQGYYPGYQAGYQGYYPGYQGYQGFNRGYYPGAPAVSAAFPAPAVTPAPIIAPVAPIVPKVVAAPVYKAVDNKLPAIVRQSQEVSLDGNFKYGFETENGIVAQAAGYVKNAGSDAAAQVIEGSYAYTGEDGAPVEVKYYADETGYHAVGNVVPTTPPEIAKALELIASQPQKPEEKK
ncbi:Insect cuticle protein,Chitin-binding type R&R consensus [Cinara cedri]|uniref:Insect cuticle protein,Chitin-binding type R&R consensus n=1 Tax=Cinara cedri TaxID=506608 RepID=A0A5E4NQK7_9HEMI|nr:Insect cuticle protein,Chitin-binding type R&R consensus [Cinara cedri]